MNAQEYCEMVQQKDRLQKSLVPTIPIRENHSPLVSLKESGFDLIFEPSIKKDYKYLVREDIFAKIGRICTLLNKQNRILIIRSVWRSFKHQQLLWDHYLKIAREQHPGERLEESREHVSSYIASEKLSMHSTGGAVDALIYDVKEDRVLDFGTNDGYKIDLNSKCYPYHPDISPVAKENRQLLISLFENEDFVCDLKEYWHFDYGNAVWAIEKKKEYSIYDIIGE
jgi:D-alanyl-D-alanine dipeptidase